MKKSLAALALSLALAAGASAMFINNTVQVPVDRVVTNVEAWIKEKPKDAQAYYVLGRIHAMAWAYGPNLSLWKAAPARGRAQEPPADDPFNGQLPGFAPYDSIQVRRAEDKKQLTPEDAQHLAAAIANYTKAIELDPAKALYELGLAWILQETGAIATQLPADFPATAAKPTAEETAAYEAALKKLGDADAKVRDDASKTLAAALPKSYRALRQAKSDDAEANARVQSILKQYWNQQALDHYRKAYDLNLKADLAPIGTGPSADSKISAEAADAILSILKQNPAAAKPNEEQEVAANLKKLQSSGRAMTPIVFALPAAQQPAQIADLVNPAARVPFDLAGDNLPREWPWLKPGTALLVWDPQNTGHITSGRALFGSRTWWIDFRDGYEALSVLDDNRDGQLTGPELEGIRAWIDVNGNAQSDPGEVVSLASLHIDAITLHPTHAPDGILTSTIHFSTGQQINSFDWVTKPLEP